MKFDAFNTANRDQLEQEIKDKLKNWKQVIQEYQIPDTKKAILQIITTFLPYIALWTLMYFSLNWSIWLTIGIGIINVFFLVRIFIIQHDCGHQSFLDSKRWNNVIGVACSIFSTIPYKYWAKVHNHHHGHTGQLEERNIGDINFITVDEYRNRSKWGRFKYRLFRHPVVLFLVVPTLYFAVSNRIPSLKLKGWNKIRITQVINNLIILGVYILLAMVLGWKKFLFIQLLLVLSFFCVAFWFFYVQHQHEETYMRWRHNWDFLVASIRGASYYKLPKLFQWLTGNIGLHHIHHLSARIPNYNLEKCMRDNPLFTKYAVTLSFWDSLKTVTLKLYDEERKRMITFREFYKMEGLRLA
jgi:omega-6 fatty acid desaturase (delta-12 desaturase)